MKQMTIEQFAMQTASNEPSTEGAIFPPSFNWRAANRNGWQDFTISKNMQK